jgi:hypothetical protein
MAFANPSVSDIIATTIQARNRKIADNVTKNNALLAKLQQKGRIKTVSGGNKILEELSFAQNGNAGFYSGYDLLPVAQQDVISAAEYDFKQAACPVIISGLEMLQNSGREALIDLMEGRLTVAESTMANLIAGSLYSNGTGSGGKEITGLGVAVPTDPSTGSYGGIDRASYPFWASQIQAPGVALTAANIQTQMDLLWAKQVRGSDRPDLIIMASSVWNVYVASLQAQQRFTSPETGNLGFPTLKFMDADVVLDGGIGGFCTDKTAFFLNSKYIKFRPHSQRNFTSLSPSRRYAINQDAEVAILAWAGNLTTSGSQFQGRLTGT